MVLVVSKRCLIETVQANSWIHAALFFCVLRGWVHGWAGLGTEKRFGGAANGTPKNLLIAAGVPLEAGGNDAAVPITTPPLMVAVGGDVGTAAWAILEQRTAGMIALE